MENFASTIATYKPTTFADVFSEGYDIGQKLGGGIQRGMNTVGNIFVQNKMKQIFQNPPKLEDGSTDYAKLSQLLVPYDLELSQQYAKLAETQLEKRKGLETNKKIAAAFMKPKEEYEESIKSWQSKASTIEGLEKELSIAEDELNELQNELESAQNESTQSEAQSQYESIPGAFSGYRGAIPSINPGGNFVNDNRYSTGLTNTFNSSNAAQNAQYKMGQF